jgi:molybdopterin synthase catalytic subunit
VNAVCYDAGVRVKVLFFGQLKDIVGTSEESLDLAPGGSLESVFAHYRSRFPKLDALAPSIVVARNHQFAPLSTPVADSDEIALLPPVSGGTGSYSCRIEHPAGHFFGLTRAPIDERALRHRILRGEDGAIVAFEGVVRNNTKGRATLYLDYEGYEPMAIQVIERIGCEIASTNAIGRLAIVHRLGRMNVGETSVLVVVAAPHRKPAFEAALEGINRVKRMVPIWKKEHFADGEVWVDGEWDESVIGRP